MLRKAIKCKGSGQSDVPPSRGLWWPRAVLCKVNLTFCRMQLRRQKTVRHTPPVEAVGGQDQYYVRSTWHSAECNWEGRRQSDIPPVEAAGGQDQYYVRSTWHCAECNWEGRWQSNTPPSRGIWWSRVVLHQVNLTFWGMQLRRQWTVRD